ncbi:deoxyribodipyrimidine photo-lyase [Altererythrobacter salegens]|uniref:Deoxyribodipyrimidine photo-lyase n=1 Tax=Croceibacterium salegens TaxID=1737568 RepID=A0A6I4SUB7_9SPHN|nr:deoxyribodipyrimidine photo-lyase [Croceibacterium salegens]MXO58687.1 deoxyribodipyrimidine photo-lyase [Croceibacterium salegens]
MASPQIVWLRRDLRLADQEAFHAAAARGPVIPVYVLDDESPKHRTMGGASRWWLHHSLASLASDLHKHSYRLILRRGRAAEVLVALARETGAGSIHALRHYEPWWRNAERELKESLPDGIKFIRHDGLYLLPPGTVTTGSGGPYKIFTPFYRAMRERLPPGEPLAVPELALPESWPESDKLEDWNLLPTKPDWSGSMNAAWQVGEGAAHEQLDAFAEHASKYEAERNLPAIDGSSRLSPHLHFGEISPRQVWSAFADRRGKGVESFLRELVWRDYAANVMLQFPDYPEHSYKVNFANLAWRDHQGEAAADLEAWKRGRTGYPIVDAGMRQLWATGWMHNRVRMIAASFLIKHLLIDWRVGERWFWDTLVDADYASNGTNWQWVAGTGVDANMFVRIMAPLLQSEKFDAAGYIRQWVPELAGLPDEVIHDPSDMERPDDYPPKIVEHRTARERALGAFREL